MHLNRVQIETFFFFFKIFPFPVCHAVSHVFFNDNAIGIEDEYLVIS